jgi:PAS domain S-box-containing protein
MSVVSETTESRPYRVEDDTLGARRARADLDCLPMTIVRLDEHGRIQHVNEAWRRFARDNDADTATRIGVGLDYLAVCEAADDPSARLAAEGIRALLGGAADGCEVTYCCHSRERRRWCRMSGRRSSEPEVGVVLTHFDVTALHRAETRSLIQASVTRSFAMRKSLLESCRELALVTCEKLEWDYMGIWTLDPAAWKLRCIDLWIRPGSGLEVFERTTWDASLGPGVGLPGRAWANRAGTWVTDRVIDPALSGTGKDGAWMVMPHSARNAGLRSGFAFPLKCDDDVLAVIELYGRIREELNPELLKILEVCGVQLALAELRDRAEQRAEAAQHEADSVRERLEAVLACAPAIVIALDRSGVIQFLNRTAAHLDRDEVVGRDWTEFVTPENRATMQAALRTVLDGGAPQTFDTTTALRDGRQSCHTNHLGPMYSAGQIAGAVLIAQDVTDFRRTEAELFESQRLASIGTLAAGVAHEINTPLQFIGDNLEFLRESSNAVLQRVVPALQNVCKTFEQQPSIDAARAAVASALEAQRAADFEFVVQEVPSAFDLFADGLQRVTTIVRSLKEFSHPAQETMVAADLNRAIQATLTVARNEYKYVADLETDFGELPPVSCHINQINQAVLNIVINAAHALADKHRGTDHKGVIHVSTRVEDASVVIAIRDTPGGIPENIRSRIFDPFVTTKEVGRGTGQGLAIAWNSIKKVHGGELTFESTVGEGTEFFIRLPIKGIG